jgi:ABC-2 type transport system permease protein
MSPRRTLATAVRVLRQLRHDPRTIALILFVPPILITILKYVLDKNPVLFDGFAPMVLGVFPFTVMFIVTSIAMLRERTSGTLERLMTTPIGKLDLLVGYALAFGSLAIVQGLLSGVFTLWALGVHIHGSTAAFLLVVLLCALLGNSLGLFVSAFARTEFQAVQFLPAVIFPQMLVSGLFVPRDQMAKLLQWVADVLPVTYSVDGMKQVSMSASWNHNLTTDLLVVALYIVATLLLAATTLRRQS